MSYRCEPCGYITEDRGNFCKHKKTARHAKKMEENDIHQLIMGPIIDVHQNGEKSTTRSTNNSTRKASLVCQFCGDEFSRPYCLRRHQNLGRCKGNVDIILRLGSKIKDMETKILIQNIEHKHQLVEVELKTQLQAERQFSKEKTDIITSGKIGSTVNYNVPVKTFVKENYGEAPILVCLDHEQMKLLGHEEKHYELGDVLVYYFRKNQLGEYLGSFLVKRYKKKDPSEQSLWTSDGSRHSYLIREFLNNQESIWNLDKCCVKTRETIIEPLLDYIKEKLDGYIKKKQKEDVSVMSLERTKEHGEKINDAYKIISMIVADPKPNRLHRRIIKYITPHFHLDPQDKHDGSSETSDIDEISSLKGSVGYHEDMSYSDSDDGSNDSFLEDYFDEA